MKGNGVLFQQRLFCQKGNVFGVNGERVAAVVVVWMVERVAGTDAKEWQRYGSKVAAAMERTSKRGCWLTKRR
jgi:hypothetical protein